MTIQVPVVVSDGATVPAYQSSGAAGIDVCTTEDIELQPLERCVAPTGLRLAIPPGFEGQVRPRSGLAAKHGIAMVNSPGTIDSDYRGEIKIIMINFGQTVVKLPKGARVAQIVFSAVARAHLQEVEFLEETERGHSGFGSTGI